MVFLFIFVDAGVDLFEVPPHEYSNYFGGLSSAVEGRKAFKVSLIEKDLVPL